MSSDQFDISELEPNLLVDDSSAVFDLIYNKDDLPLPDVIGKNIINFEIIKHINLKFY